LKGEAQIEGRGERFLNMIHRDDVVGAIIAALHHGGPGEVYNVVDDEPVQQIDLYRWLAEKSGGALPPFAPADPTTARKRGVTNKQVSNSNLRGRLSYRFKYPTFREGFESLV
jgi:nucleoside-diphosphate-sugar epimerase